MSQMHELRQDENSSYNRRLDFGKFTAEVLNKDFFGATGELNRLLID